VDPSPQEPILSAARTPLSTRDGACRLHMDKARRTRITDGRARRLASRLNRRARIVVAAAAAAAVVVVVRGVAWQWRRHVRGW